MAKKTVVRSMRILMRALVVTVGLYLTVNAAVLLTALVSLLTGWYPACPRRWPPRTRGVHDGHR